MTDANETELRVPLIVEHRVVSAEEWRRANEGWRRAETEAMRQLADTMARAVDDVALGILTEASPVVRLERHVAQLVAEYREDLRAAGVTDA